MMSDSGENVETSAIPSPSPAGVKVRSRPKPFTLTRPLKKSTMDRISQIKSAVLSSKENGGKENQAPGCNTPTSVDKDENLDHKTFVFEGQMVTLSGDIGSSLLDDVFSLIKSHYNKKATDSENSVHKSTQTDNNLGKKDEIQQNGDVVSDVEQINPTVKKTAVEEDDLTTIVKKLRELSCSDNIPLEGIMCSPKGFSELVEGLGSTKLSVQLDSVWACINISAMADTRYTECLLKHGVLKELKKLVASSHTKLAAHAVWVLSNIAGDSWSSMKQLMETGALCTVLDIARKLYNYDGASKSKLKAKMQRNSQLEKLVKQTAWFLVNVCRQMKHTQLSLNTVIDIYTTLGIYASYSDDLGIIQDALWAFLYLCEDGKNMYWEKVPQDITYGFMKVCTQMLGVDIDSELMAVSLRLLRIHASDQSFLWIVNEFDFVNSSNLRLILESGSRDVQVLALQIIDILLQTHGTPWLDKEVLQRGSGFTLNSIVRCAMEFQENSEHFIEAVWLLCDISFYLEEEHLWRIRDAPALAEFCNTFKKLMVDALQVTQDYQMQEYILDALINLRGKKALMYGDPCVTTESLHSVWISKHKPIAERARQLCRALSQTYTCNVFC